MKIVTKTQFNKLKEDDKKEMNYLVVPSNRTAGAPRKIISKPDSPNSKSIENLGNFVHIL
eukprot:SAG31_NODE_34210_length_334_cov_1.008475_2_plen_60_part_00